jgi:uncharacterized protein (TIGR03437 family)
MQMACLKRAALTAILISGWMAPVEAASTTAITASPASLSFSYQVNSTTLPAASKVTVTLPSGTASSTSMTATATSTVGGIPTTQGWLAATPESGHSPLALTVTANPTGLAPGSYTGTITITATTTPATTSCVVPVVMSVSNPPSNLEVAQPYSANYTPPVGSTNGSLSFTYTTGDPAGPAPLSAALYVASSGDIISFNVAAAVTSSKSSSSTAVWIQVAQQGAAPSTQTSGVALSGSSVPITVSLDATTVETLDPGAYGGTITIAANNKANGTITVNVNLVVSAGGPSLYSIYPSTVVAGPTVSPVVTIYGENFFSTSVATLQLQGSTAPATQLTSTLLSREVLQATIPATLLAAPGVWTLAVSNPAPPNNPGQTPVTTIFTVVDATTPIISSVVNAGSYLPTSSQTGTNPNPVSAVPTSVAPGEIISIFGQNLGPAAVTSATPSGLPLAYQPSLPGVGITVTFQISPTYSEFAPLLMVSDNQINAIVPADVVQQAAVGATISVYVSNGGNSTPLFPLTVVSEDPGVFTFGGLGQGQAAILNYNSSTQGYSINSTSSPATRGSTILIYATGLGVLSAPIGAGSVAASGITVQDPVIVEIAGQPAVVSYAGTSPGAVAGLVQINAVVPPTVTPGSAVTLTVAGGTAKTARQSQSGVTLVVK